MFVENSTRRAGVIRAERREHLLCRVQRVSRFWGQWGRGGEYGEAPHVEDYDDHNLMMIVTEHSVHTEPNDKAGNS